MASCARYGCKLEICLEAQRRAVRENHKEGGARIDCAEVRQYTVKLVNSGMSVIDISDCSGVSQTQVRSIFRGKAERVHRVTAEAILGIPFPEYGRLPDTDGLTDATGARRRLQALTVQGFSIGFMARQNDDPVRTLSVLRHGARTQIRISRLRTIVALHDEFWDRDPREAGLAASAVTRAKAWAEGKKWWPTEAWDDIDDPDCKPKIGTPRYVALTEDARELMDEHGQTRKQAALRLGVKTDTLTAAMQYYDRKMATA